MTRSIEALTPLGKICYHEKDKSVFFKVTEASDDHVILKQIYPNRPDHYGDEYPMRYFNNIFIILTPSESDELDNCEQP